MGIPDPLNAPAPRVTLCPLAPAHLVGLGALQAAIVLVFVGPWWSALIPLGGFVIFMGLAAFFPDWRLFLPVVRCGPAADRVALTFDDGPDPATTPQLLDLLERRGARATFFVIGEKVDACPELVARILQAGHELGNHTQRHDPLLMLRSQGRLRRSVAACQHSLAAFGVRPRAFRPPAWVVNPRLWRVLLEQGLTCVTARVRGLDRGNRSLRGLAARVLRRVRGGDIVALHDCAPKGRATLAEWLAEVAAILDGLGERGLSAQTLSAVLGRPMMEPLPETATEARSDAAVPAAVRAFYDGLAADYDREQASGGQTGVRAAEQQAVLAWFDAQPALGRVLELGAGTGRFTLALSPKATSVLAVDLSAAMLRVLAAKAQEAGLAQVQTRAADVHDLAEMGPFDLICSFSALEYVPDLDALFTRWAKWLAPGGRLFVTTARRSPLRLIGQVGNALRQGLWLHARSCRGLRQQLEKAGFSEVTVRPLGPAGLLLAAEAQRAAGA